MKVRQRAKSQEKEEPQTPKPRARTLPPDIQASFADFDKAHGEGILMRPGATVKFNVIPTGIFILDFALLGGWPQGFVSMTYGYHSTAKSTIFLNGVREFQRKHDDKYVVWIDAEGLYDEEWARMIGVDTHRIIVARPEYGEQAVDILEHMIQQPSVGLIVLDSIPACAPMKVLENSAEDDTMAALARLMGKMCSKITTRINAERRKGHYVTIWNINQIRNKVGFVLGSPRHLPGGFQINHVPTTKVWLKLTKEVEGKDEFDNVVPDYNEQAFEIEKRKHGSSINSGAFDLILNPKSKVRQGCVDNVDTTVAFAKKFGFIRGGGGNFSLLTEKLGYIENTRTGERREKPHTKFAKLDDIKQFLYENEEELATLQRSIIAEQRVSKNLEALPPDGYLVSAIGRLVRLNRQG
jgi:recombination protein RecA